MKFRGVFATLSLSSALVAGVAGCAASTDLEMHTDPSRIGAEGPRASVFVHQSRTVRLASQSLHCMSGRADAAECASVAREGCVTVESLVRAQPAAIEQIEERLDAIARGEGFDNEARASVLHWFDVGAGAVREARSARAGARCARAEACRVRADGNPLVDDLENAWRADIRALQRHDAFDQLVAMTAEAAELEPEIRTTIIAVFAMRLESAANARPEVRTDAVRALATLEATMEGAALPESTNAPADAAAAHDADDSGPRVQHARETLHRHLEALIVRGGATALLDVARSIDTTVADARPASANPCGG